MKLEEYVKAFSRLRTDKNTKRWTEATKYRAPHKPLLLLSVLDLFAQGNINANLIEITPEIGELFAGYWSKIMPAGVRGNIALPFFHLRSSSFWHLIPKPNREQELVATRQVDTLRYLDRIILGASLDEDLYALLSSASARNALRSALIISYFASELHTYLFEQGLIHVQSFEYSQLLIEKSRRQIREGIPVNEQKVVIRDRGFRQAIMHLYNHRCAFCGVRLMTPDGHSVVEAAHIIPWSVSHDDDPHNGLALCRLCHWTFDEGLTSLSSEYTVLLSDELRMTINMAGHMLTLENRPIIGPNEKDLWPNQNAINWHLHNIFRGL